MRVLVTGSASHLARAVVPRLLDCPRVDRVTGVDLRASGRRHPKYAEALLDVRSPELARWLDGVDAVVHMAFVVMPGSLGRQRRNRALMRDINVRGSANLFALARAAGVARVIHLSSAAVYGAWPDNPPRIDEDWPRRPMPGFAYAEDKVAVEAWLDAFEAQGETPAVVRLRPHAILGPHAQPLLRFLLRQPCYPRLPDPQPLSQCVWEEDVAAAVEASLLCACRGSYNLAADPPLSFQGMQRLLHRRPLPVPFALARAAHRGLWLLTAAGGEPAWLAGMRYPLALDCRRAREILAWQPLDTAACLARLRAQR